MEPEISSRIAGFLLYGMLGFPFLIWAGTSALRGTRQRQNHRPGIGSTLFFLCAPLVFLGLHFAPGSDHSPETASSFLMLPPAFGLIAGYITGFLLGRLDVKGYKKP